MPSASPEPPPSPPSPDDPVPGGPWDLPLRQCPFALLDLEMTGLDPDRDAIVEVAITRVVNGRVVDALDSVVHAEVDSHPAALALHGLGPAELARAPRFAELAPRVAALLHGAVPVAHGTGLDAAFLNRALAEAGCDLRLAQVLDTVTLARRALHARSYALGALGEKLGLGAHRWHRAGEDVRALTALFQRLVPLFDPPDARDLWQVRVGQVGPVLVRDSIARGLAALAGKRPQVTVVVRTPGHEARALKGRVLRWAAPHVTLSGAGGVRIVRADRVLRIETP